MNDYFHHLKCGKPRDLSGRIRHIENENFPKLGEECAARVEWRRADCYKHCVKTCVWMLYLNHFGFRGSVTPQQITDKGVEMAIGYFGVGVVREALSTGGAQTAWFEPYCEAMLLATLGRCKRERIEISDCLRPNLVVETVAIPIEPALGDVLLCIAASFQSSPMDTAPLQDRLQQSRKKRPKLLLSAWQALESQDKAKFATALADATANFAKTTAEDDLPLTAVAVLESILAGLAYERGWTDLAFELPIAARLVTHQSLGLT